MKMESVVVIIAGPPPRHGKHQTKCASVDNVTITNVVAMVLFIIGSVILSNI